METQKERYYAALMQNRAAEVIRVPEAPGLSNAVNLTACAADGDVLLFLPAGTALYAQDAVEHMLELALQPHVCGVGGVTGARGEACGIIHNVRALEGIMMVRKAEIFAGGCFEATDAEAGFVRAHTLLCGTRGRHNVVTPYARFCAPAENTEKRIGETNRMRIKDLRGLEKA